MSTTTEPNDRQRRYNELDPFGDHEEDYKTGDIKYSKARLTKRRVDAYRKQQAPENNIGKKTSILRKIKRFFKELPDREDKRRIYFRIAVTLILIVLISVSLPFSINFIIKNRKHDLEIEEAKADIESAQKDFFFGELDEEDDLENYKLEIEKKYSSTNDPDLKYLYRKELISLYFEDEEKSQETIRLINEQLSYEKITIQEKVTLLAALIDLCKLNDMTDELKSALNELLNIPDDGEMTFGGETLTELKARVKNENS